jgi:hypothetical protein
MIGERGIKKEVDWRVNGRGMNMVYRRKIYLYQVLLNHSMDRQKERHQGYRPRRQI